MRPLQRHIWLVRHDRIACYGPIKHFRVANPLKARECLNKDSLIEATHKEQLLKNWVNSFFDKEQWVANFSCHRQVFESKVSTVGGSQVRGGRLFLSATLKGRKRKLAERILVLPGAH